MGMMGCGPGEALTGRIYVCDLPDKFAQLQEEYESLSALQLDFRLDTSASHPLSDSPNLHLPKDRQAPWATDSPIISPTQRYHA